MGTNEPGNPFTTETQGHRDSKKTNDAHFSVALCLCGEYGFQTNSE